MTKEEENFISLKDVTFRYQDSLILDNVNLSIRKNELTIIVGPNGGGKTTLVKLLLGLAKPKLGSITINGKHVSENRKSIGYVPQTLQFDSQFPISVGEFVMLGALSRLTWYGRWPSAVKQHAHELLESVDLGNFFHAQFGSLSGGQKQRATLMRAMMCDPDILVLDEPTNNLDAKSGLIFNKIIENSLGKKTILMITHFVGEFFEKADSIYVVNQTLSPISKEHVCSHYALGLFHQDDDKTDDSNLNEQNTNKEKN